jgi:thiopeptide-type bacteriocin biosynthesis protein
MRAAQQFPEQAATWRQVNITFADWPAAGRTAAEHLGPLLARAEEDRLIASWFFVRKFPAWRVRYLPAPDAPPETASHITSALLSLVSNPNVTNVSEVVYEPETCAFGGREGMGSAHRLFHADSRHLLARLASQNTAAPDRSRELTLVLTVVMLRGAGLDWYEQGDVWARVAVHRPNPGQPYASQQLGPVRRYLTADTESVLSDGAPLAVTSGWGQAFGSAGADLAMLSSVGLLHRGLRAVLAHHVIFTWNRHGLPYDTQAQLASSARDAVFGADPTAQQDHRRGEAR